MGRATDDPRRQRGRNAHVLLIVPIALYSGCIRWRVNRTIFWTLSAWRVAGDKSSSCKSRDERNLLCLVSVGHNPNHHGATAGALLMQTMACAAKRLRLR
jgi:hypothetical protein